MNLNNLREKSPSNLTNVIHVEPQNDAHKNLNINVEEKSGSSELFQRTGRSITIFDSDFDITPRNLNGSPDIYKELTKLPIQIFTIIGLCHKKSDRFIFKLYRMFLLSVMWCNVIRFIFAYNFTIKESEKTFSLFMIKIISQVWFLSVAFNSTLIYFNQQKTSRESYFLDCLNVLLTCPGYDVKRTKKFIYIIFFVGFSIGLTNSIVICAFIMGPRVLLNSFAMYLSPMSHDEWALDSVPLKLFMVIITNISALHWINALTYFFIHLYIMVVLLENFLQKFKRFVKKTVIVDDNSLDLFTQTKTNLNEDVFLNNDKKLNVSEQEFENFRTCHLKLSHLVSQFDNCYKQLIGMTMLCYTFIILLMLYVMSDWVGNCVTGTIALLVPFWALLATLITFIIVTFSAKIATLVIIINYF